MISLLGSLFGFGSSLIGPVLETWNKSSDQKHELAMLIAQAEVPAGLVLDHFLPPQLDQSGQKYNAEKIREPGRNAQCPVGYEVATDSCGVAPQKSSSLSKAKAMRRSFASLYGAPINYTLAGNPFASKPVDKVTAGKPR